MASTELRAAAQQALEFLDAEFGWSPGEAPRITALKAALAEPVQEPVAYSVGRTLHWHEGKGVNDAQLYAAPPQRKPLTEEEIGIICASLGFAQISPVEVARAIERAHGIGGQP